MKFCNHMRRDGGGVGVFSLMVANARPCFGFRAGVKDYRVSVRLDRFKRSVVRLSGVMCAVLQPERLSMYLSSRLLVVASKCPSSCVALEVHSRIIELMQLPAEAARQNRAGRLQLSAIFSSRFTFLSIHSQFRPCAALRLLPSREPHVTSVASLPEARSSDL